MDADNNEVENDSNAVNSIRLKYKGGRRRKKGNYREIKATKNEVISQLEEKPIIQTEKIIIKEESNTNEVLAKSPNDIVTKITTTKTVLKDNERGKSRQEITTTKKEIKDQNEANNTSIRSYTLNEDRNASSSQKKLEISTKGKMNVINTDVKNAGNPGREIKEESTIKKKIIMTVSNQGSRTQSIEKTEKEIIINHREMGRRSRGGKEESIKKIIKTTLNKSEGSESQGRSSQKGKIISLKNVIKNSPATNGRQSYQGKRNLNDSRESKEINLTEGLSINDIKGLRKEMINQFFTYPDSNNRHTIQIQERKVINPIQRQIKKDDKGSRKELQGKSNSNSAQNNRKKSQKYENEELNLTEGLSNKAIKDLRSEMMDQFFSYPDSNNRSKIKSKERKEIKAIKEMKEISPIQKRNNKDIKSSKNETAEKSKLRSQLIKIVEQKVKKKKIKK